tara:strand:+ start:5958 stop:6236 length:279 start_codon:yes stop_codon:yes gene_type:complete
MSDYETIFKANVFKNQERFSGGEPMSGGKPNYSNNKITLHAPIPAGEYSLGIWQYADTGNLSVKLDSKPPMQHQQQPQAQNESDEVLDDFLK